MDRFCTKCGQKLEDNAAFCTNCGTPSPVESSNGSNDQPVSLNKPGGMNQQDPNPNMGYQQTQNTGYQQNQGMGYQQNSTASFQQNPNAPYAQHNPHMNQNTYQEYHSAYDPKQDIPPEIRSKNTLAMVFGIIGVVLSFFGAIMFGLFLSIPGLILGVLACILGVNLKKYSNGVIGMVPLIIGIIAVAFGCLFSIGCSLYSCGDFGGYGCYGILGGTCKASSDIVGLFR